MAQSAFFPFILTILFPVREAIKQKPFAFLAYNDNPLFFLLTCRYLRVRV